MLESATQLLQRARIQSATIAYALLVLIFFVTQKYFWWNVYSVELADFGLTFFGWTLTHRVRIIGIFLVCLLALLVGHKQRWSDFEAGTKLRTFTMVLFLTFAFYFVFSPYSLYLDKGLYVDRIIFALVVIALWFRPALAPLALMFALLSLAPQRFAIKGLGMTDKRLLVSSAIFVVTWIALHPVIKWKPQALFASLLSLVGASYFFPALQKVRLSPNLSEWVFDNKLENLMVISRVNGWLSGLDMQTWINITEAVGHVALPLAIVTLAVEFSGVLLPYLRAKTPLLLIVFALFHLGVWLSSGIFFWKWMIVEFALAWVLYRGPKDWTAFNMPLRVLMLLSMILSFNLFRVSSLGWFDTPYDQGIDIVAVGESGTRYEVPSAFFAPQDIYFSQNRARSYYGSRRGVETYGGTLDFDLFELLQNAKDHEETYKIIQRLEIVRPGNKSDFAKYLTTTFANANQFQKRPLRFLPHIQHIWQSANGPEFNFQERIVRVDIEFVESTFKNKSVHEHRREVVQRLAIPRIKKNK